ncbi:unnamed protein product [Periconia digitata]|uniref:Uncharacterized protein n=1 Tax=Periconia digitata TaxID=1303443 RepID=A0A9W4UUQ4_9PLEO|nr:unnamed protein product [Periconia digitata]
MPSFKRQRKSGRCGMMPRLSSSFVCWLNSVEKTISICIIQKRKKPEPLVTMRRSFKRCSKKAGVRLGVVESGKRVYHILSEESTTTFRECAYVGSCKDGEKNGMCKDTR